MEVTAQKARYISLSQARMWLRCQRQHWYRYGMGRIQPPSGAMVVGSAAHKGIQHHMTVKALKEVDPPWDEVADAYSQAFDEQAPDALWIGEDPGTAKDRGYATLEVFHKNDAPKIVPASPDLIERKIEVPMGLDGITIAMVLDLMDAQSNLMDFKVTGRRPGSVPADVVAQLRLYQYGANSIGLPVDNLQAIYLVATKEPNTVTHNVTKGTPSEVAGILRMLRDVRLSIEKAYEDQLFLPALQGSWWCQEDTCGYWKECHRDFG